MPDKDNSNYNTMLQIFVAYVDPGPKSAYYKQVRVEAESLVEAEGKALGIIRENRMGKMVKMQCQGPIELGENLFKV